MEIKDYKAGDEAQILKLFHSTFGKPMGEDYWKWRFSGNPENKVMIKLMWDKNSIIGHYAVSPIKLNVNSKSILTALSMTTMTHPAYAGRGIFTELAKALYQDEAKRNGLKAVWGFPNNNSHYGFIKNLNWKNLEQIPTFSIEVGKIKKSDSSSISLVSSFNNNHILAWQNVTKNYLIKVEKTINYLTWRYLQNPINKYDLFEMKNNDAHYYAITKIFPSFTEKNKFEIDILELIFPSDLNSLLQLLNAIKKYYKNYDLLKINTWLPLNDCNHIYLEKIGFLNSVPITYAGIHTLDSNYSNLENPVGWLYSMGDSDIY